LATVAGALPCGALSSDTPARSFLASQGFASPPALYADALDAFLSAEAAYRRGAYAEAQKTLDALWAAHPPGTDEWAAAYRQAWDIGRSHGINVGCPSCYYALRMLTECVRWRTGPHGKDRPRATATLGVVLVGKAAGAQPSSVAELERGEGRKVALTIEPQLLAGEGRVIRDSLWLFNEYMQAASDGRLAVRTRLISLPDLDVPVSVSLSNGRRFAGLAGGAWGMIWASVPEQARAATDWWWILYPSCIPEQHPDFARAEFITGGMGTGPDGISPCFIIDDRWLTRKPPHLGKGPYTEIERRAYLPQWLQHEFMHHLFRIYPSFGLEAKDHQWFDRKTWPADFEGRIEPDYYAEALSKRIQPRGDPPLHMALRYTPPPARLFMGVRLDDLIGTYRHEPVQNDWHIGALSKETVGGKVVLRWTNKAGATWVLTPDLAAGLLRTGPDCPYYDAVSPEAGAFRIKLKRDQDGRWRPEVEGFAFGGGAYRLEGTRRSRTGSPAL
jgi:hypothetical protein